ncbi:RNA polymerase sigma factor SigM [Janibacter sp. G368]|uniref:RNA polymerase sigma factor SigM n=1 Tax=Janibacter sp. G368 TaxID=3420441 RepID=UPI003CFD5974
MSDSPFAEIDDRMLMRMHVEGDAEAFGEIYRRHRDRMWAVAVGVCGDRELAAEAVQDAFVSAFRRAGSYRGDAAVTTWLHRIVVNACIDLNRRVRPTSELTDEVVAAAPPAPDATGRVDTRLAVHEAMRRLPDEQRVALVLVDMHGVPVAEAAQVLDIPTGTVKSRCSRGREALGKALAAAGIDPRGTSDVAASSDTTGHQADEGR